MAASVNPVIVNLEAGVPKGRAVGIQIGATGLNEGAAGPFKGAVVNSGAITAIGRWRELELQRE